ncbi:hypothetical protein AUG19_02330 [archaeon 13_1_20CM_2_54_9]|nr:MAG: hypothetical protein AUJ07_10740 [Crenarchaeota archaeon 13_1_40CM_3_53_5]OLE76604.1 MAG: hypothetical protein AUG19_02330 [archaeon 13_1_20CM_2_54_9]
MARARSVTRTVRLDEDVDHQIQELAGKEKVSVSQVVNKALRKLVELDTYVTRFGFVTIPTSVHAKLFSYLSDEEAREAGGWAGRNFARDFTIFRFKKITLETILNTLTLLGSDYAGVFEIEDQTEGGNHTLVIKHGRGMKESVFNEEFLKVIFKELLSIELRTELMEDQVVAHVSARKGRA